MTGLFVRGLFTLHSGAASRWKIECDALSEGDWLALAEMAGCGGCRGFYGIPRGGLPFARALEQVYGWDDAPALHVDDVWTTGGSMRAALGRDPDARGLVAFARTPVDDPRVRAVWTLSR